MPIIPPHPSRPPGEPLTVEYLAAQLRWLDASDEPYRIVQERRLTALEEALVSRKARRRLRREIRQSTRTFAWVGPAFHGRRVEAVGNEMLTYYGDTAERAA
jgi:hypothetical protein